MSTGAASAARPLSIKLCGIRSVADALFCASAGADELGLVFAKQSKRRVSLDAAAAIAQALPSGFPVIGVFQDAPFEDLWDALVAVPLSAVQLHGELPPGLFSLASRARLGVPIHLAVQIAGPESLEALDALDPGKVARVLLDGPRGGSGSGFPWPLLHAARARFPGPLHLAGGLSPGNVAEAIRAALPDGVDVSSGIEGPDGFKDRARVREFVAAARDAARALRDIS